MTHEHMKVCIHLALRFKAGESMEDIRKSFEPAYPRMEMEHFIRDAMLIQDEHGGLALSKILERLR